MGTRTRPKTETDGSKSPQGTGAGIYRMGEPERMISVSLGSMNSILFYYVYVHTTVFNTKY